MRHRTSMSVLRCCVSSDTCNIDTLIKYIILDSTKPRIRDLLPQLLRFRLVVAGGAGPFGPAAARASGCTVVFHRLVLLVVCSENTDKLISILIKCQKIL